MKDNVMSWLSFNESIRITEEAKQECEGCHEDVANCTCDDKKDKEDEEEEPEVKESISVENWNDFCDRLDEKKKAEDKKASKMKAEPKKDKKDKKTAPKKDEKEGGKKGLSAAQMKLPWNKNK